MKNVTDITKSVSLISQFQHENDTWKRVLGFLTEENIFLKNRLSEVLRCIDDSDNSFLERIEYFQNGFLEKDKIISDLRTALMEHNKLLIRDMYEDGELLKEVKWNQKKFRKDIETAEQECNKLKFEFNNYLGQIL